MYFAVFAEQIQQAAASLVFIITQLNAPHLTVTYLPYDKYKDVFIITQLNAPHLTVAYLPLRQIQRCIYYTIIFIFLQVARNMYFGMNNR